MPVEGVLNPVDGMQSEPGWPQIILHVYRRPPGEEGAAIVPERSEDEGEGSGGLCCRRGRLSPNNCSRYLHADRPHLACRPEALSRPKSGTAREGASLSAPAQRFLPVLSAVEKEASQAGHVA